LRERLRLRETDHLRDESIAVERVEVGGVGESHGVEPQAASRQAQRL
jgi:hypothetical protein